MHKPRWPTARYLDCRGVAAVLLVALVDVLLGEEVRLLPLYAVGPALAACRASVRGVLGTGLFAASLATVLALDEGLLDSRRGVSSLLAITLVTLFSAAAARIRLRGECRLAAVSDVADAARRTIVAPVPVDRGPVRIAASYESAAEAAGIGGDFYEVVPVDGGVRILVGDVQGKGLDAVGVAAAVLAAFRESAPVADRLDTVGVKLSCALLRRGDERFVTAVMAEVTWDGTMRILNYGHPGPLVVPASGDAVRADPEHPGTPLGLDGLIECRPGRHTRVLSAGDRVLFHTDGLDETRDAAGRFYPLLERGALLRGGTAEAGLRRLRADACRHAAPRHSATGCADDSALLLLDYREEHGPRPRSAPADPAPPTLRTTDLGCHVCAVTDCPLADLLRSRGASGDAPAERRETTTV
ncbi:PP2C family protein-serine/threonine phosphatase [Streptomyces sp. NPDC059783]|uniref:PP2C family protein-serine/threonine phosphatase n=1 Tax=Streptomyces sp. NPDC059783 TaxID=3346944 RepID=UPI003666FCB8